MPFTFPPSTERNKGSLQAQWVMGAVATNGTLYFTYQAPYGGTVDTVKAVSAFGSVTLGVQINGLDVTGLTSVSISSTPVTGTATGANSFSAGDTITGIVSGATGNPTGLVISLNVTWS